MPWGVAYWKPHLWIEMIKGIDPAYFHETGRIPEDKIVDEIHPIDCTVYNDEGDEWVLSLVNLSFVDKTSPGATRQRPDPEHDTH